MQTYTVKDIAEMLGTSQETVRRWIRDRELNAVQESRKSGNSVTEADLNDFLKRHPRYSRSTIEPVSTVLEMLTATVSELYSEFQKKHPYSLHMQPEEMAKHIEYSLEQHSKSLNKKRKAMEQLQEEIESEEQQIEGLKEFLSYTKDRIKKGTEDE